MNKKIDSISGLAGFAALMVIYAHMGSEGFLRLSHHFNNLGVMIFFSLSGFLLSYLYIDKKFCAEDVTAYSLARFTRIAPAYLFTILASFVIFTCFDPQFVYQIGAHNLLRHLLFIGNESVFWTIGPQVQFYILFLLLWSATAHYVSTKNAMPLIFIVFACVLLIMLRRSLPGTFVGANLHYFAFGVLAGVVRRKMHIEFHQPQLINIIHVSLLLIFLGVECGVIQLSERMTHENLSTLVMAVLVAFFIFVFSFDSLSARLLFGNPLLRLMGSLSFSLYLLHMPVLYWVKKLYPDDIAHPVVVALTFVLIIALATLYFYTVERYCALAVKNLGKKYAGRIEGMFTRLGVKNKATVS